MLFWMAGAFGADTELLQIQFRMPDMPPTRTICEVRSEGQTSMLEWDPDFPSPLQKTVRVPDVGAWPDVDCWSRIPAHDAVAGMPTLQPTRPYWVFGKTSTWTIPPDDEEVAALRQYYEMVLSEESSEESSKEAKAAVLLSDGEAKIRRSGSLLPEDVVDQLADGVEYINACLEKVEAKDPASSSCKLEIEDIKDRVEDFEQEVEAQQTILEKPIALKLEVKLCEPGDSRQPVVSLDDNSKANPGRTGTADCHPLDEQVLAYALYNEPELEHRLHALDTQLAGAASNRSLYSPAPEAVSETLAALGTIALKRAERRTRQGISDRLTADLCDDGLAVARFWVSPGELDIGEASSPATLKLKGGCVTADKPLVYTGDKDAACDGDAGENLQFKPDFKLAHVVLRVPGAVGPGQDPDATVKKNRVTTGGKDGGSFRVAFPHTCDVIRDRPFADLASSGEEIANAMARDLVESTLLNLESVTNVDPSLKKVMGQTVRPLLQAVVPVVIDSMEEGAAPNARDAQAIIAAVRQRLKPPIGDSCGEVVGGQVLDLGLAVLADCIEAGACDLRNVAAKVADPDSYYKIDADKECNLSELDHDQQRELVQIVDGMYTAFAPDPDLKDAQRASAAIAAAFDSVSLAIDIADKDSADADGLRLLQAIIVDLKEVTLAGIREESAAIAKATTRLLIHTVELVSRDPMCDPTDAAMLNDDVRRKCFRSLKRTSRTITRVMPWVTTLVAHAEAIEAEQSSEFTDEELEQAAKAREKALEDLIDSYTSRKERNGELLVGIGANVGYRAGGRFELASTLPISPASPDKEGAQAYLTLPMGLSFQWMGKPFGAKPKERLRQAGLLDMRGFSMGGHLQLSPVDLGQFVSFDAEELTTVTWNEFLIGNVQAGLLMNTTRDAFAVSFDYRFVPAAGERGAHEAGVAVTYFVPFFDF